MSQYCAGKTKTYEHQYVISGLQASIDKNVPPKTECDTQRWLLTYPIHPSLGKPLPSLLMSAVSGLHHLSPGLGLQYADQQPSLPLLPPPHHCPVHAHHPSPRPRTYCGQTSISQVWFLPESRQARALVNMAP